MTKQTMARLTAAVLAALGLLAPTAAMAHTGIGETGGFLHGLDHPLGGLDHVLAMVLVGLLAAQIGGRALWAVPAAFVGVMAIGGVLGTAGFHLPLVEVGIALSSVVFGLAVATRVRAPVAVVAGVVGVFAFFHGHAHGAEMPETAAGLAYGAGFVAATALLHAAGIGVGLLAGRTGALAVRTAGGLAALAGVGLLTGAV